MLFANALLGASLAAFASATADLDFTSANHFKLKHAAFVNVAKFEDEEEFLLVSTFTGSPFGHGYVYMVPNIRDAVKAGDVSDLDPVQLDTPKFEWPNDVQAVPQDVFGERAIVVPDGFLVPGKSDGGVYIVRMDATELTKTTETVTISKKKGYFHHMGYWVDLNGDGRKDFITARSNAKAGEGELLWLEHPEGGLDSGEMWTEHVLGNMADVSIEVDTLPQYKHEVVVFAAQFFDEKVSMHRVSTRDGSLVQSKVIDDGTIMSAYNVSLVDLNGDGKKELLVNNHETKDKDDGIWAYPFPNDPMNDDWTRFTVASDFKNAFSLAVPNMAPGFAYAVWPNGYKKHERAHIFVAGDGDHAAHALYPTGDSSQFEYENTIFDNAKGTVGCLAFSDLDDDGWQEIWMPNYDKGNITLWKLSAKAPETEAEFLQ